MVDDIAQLFDDMTFVRRQTSNLRVLRIIDALSKRMLTKLAADDVPGTTSTGQPTEPMSTGQPSLECPVCAERRKAATAIKAKQRSRAAKGKRKAKAKPPLSPVIQTKNNAPAASPAGSPPVTHQQQSTPE